MALDLTFTCPLANGVHARPASAIATASTMTPPPAPTNLAAAATNTSSVDSANESTVEVFSS